MILTHFDITLKQGEIELRATQIISSSDVYIQIASFILAAGEKDGIEYESTSLRSFIFSFERY